MENYFNQEPELTLMEFKNSIIVTQHWKFRKNLDLAVLHIESTEQYFSIHGPNFPLQNIDHRRIFIFLKMWKTTVLRLQAKSFESVVKILESFTPNSKLEKLNIEISEMKPEDIVHEKTIHVIMEKFKQLRSFSLVIE